MSPLASLRREYESLPRLYWALWVGTFINKAGGFVIPFLSIYVGRTLGFGAAAAGATVAAYGAGNTVAGVVGGILADRVGRRFTILVSLFGGALTMVGLAFAKTVVTLWAASFAMGLVSEMYRPAVSAMIADVVPPRDRPRAYAYVYWVVNLGFAVAPPLAGLAMRFSPSMLFAVDGVTLAIYGMVVLFRVHETRPALTHSDAAKPSAIRVIATDRVFLIFVLLATFTASVMWQNGSALPLDMANNGISPLTYGALMSINGVMIVALQPIVTRVIAKRSRTRVLALASLLFGAGFALYAFVSSPVGYGVGIATWTLGEIALLPMLSVVVADLSPASMRGRYQGVYSMGWGVAATMGPLVGGFILAGSGSTALWSACAVLMLAVAGGHVALGRSRETRAAAVASAATEV